MKAMILAAGVGERMLPLTQSTPKPLLEVGGKPLLDYHLERLRQAGFCEVVINVSHLKEQIIAHCGDGSGWGLAIEYSIEHAPLETAGGIEQALPLLGDSPFLVVNGDIWTDFDFASLTDAALTPGDTAHLVFVPNRPHHPAGDFRLDAEGHVSTLPAGESGVTYAGIGVYSPALFADVRPGKLPLRPLLYEAIVQGTLGGRLHEGDWEDVGTPERLRALDARVKGR